MRGSAAFRAAVAPGGVLAGPWVRNDLWRRARAVPSLDLRFADNKSLTDAVTGQSLIAFTRASSATYVGSDGLIKTAVTNLLLRSEELATSPWFNAGVTISNNTADVADPAGTTKATKIVATGSGSAVGQGATIASSSTGSIWLRTASGTASFSLIIYLASSPFTNIGTASITVTTTWQRFTVTSSAPPSAAIYNLQLQSIPATTLYAWGAQLEQSSTAGEYVPTTSTINSAPRFDHNPTTGESLGLLVEEQRTNSIRNNTMVGAVAGAPGTLPTNWTASLAGGLSREVVGAGIANGINYIDLRIFGTTTNTNLAINLGFEATVIAAASGQSWAESVWISMVAGSTTGINYIQQNITERSASAADLAYNSGSNFVSTISSFLRRTYAVTLGNASTAYAVPALWVGHTGIGAVIDITLRIGLPQLEQGAFATSVIPTTTAAVTRSADVASITGTAFSSWYRQDEGTFFVRGATCESTFNPILMQVDDGTNNERIQLRRIGASNLASLFVVDNSVSQAAVAISTFAANTYQNVAAFYQANNFNICLAGTLGALDTSGTLPTVDRLIIGGTSVGTIAPNACISRIAYWPQCFSAANLQAITR